MTVPVDLGIGPAFHFITGPIQDDQSPHYGLKISLKAIITREVIEQNKSKIPKKYRGMASKIDEARFSPSIFIPDTLFISPRFENTAMYGISWRPIGLDLPLIKKPRLAIGIGLDLTYAYLDSDLKALGTTHFLRPGLDAKAEFEVPITDSFLISVGWMSVFYPPQKVGGGIFTWGELDESIWHLGQAFVQLHFRFPYTTTL
ncbi:MAG: hypothetical protein KC620_00030 [Myxococcales bacterium]|nr:hypothetical protein [Myxococcales bacterium]